MTVAQQGVDLAQQQLNLAKTRFEAGSAARFDVLRAEVDLANAKTTLIRARSQQDIAYQALRTVLSLPPDTPLDVQGSLEQIERLPAQAELLSTLDRRPDLRAIGAQRSQAEHAVALADGEWKPSFALTGNLQYQQDAVNAQFLDATNRSYAVGFAMRIPLFAAPGATARKATAEAQVRQARNGLDAAIDNGRLEVDLGVHRVGGRAGTGRRAAKALDLARESLSIAQVSYENGADHVDRALRRTPVDDRDRVESAQAKFAQILAAAKTRFAAGI